MSWFRRRLMMASKTKPYDAEVEYIESDGYAYINTGIKTTSTTTFDFDVYVPSFNANRWALGGRKGSTYQVAVLLDYLQNRFQWRFGSNNNINASMSSGVYNLKNTSTARTLVVNGTSYSVNSSTFTTNIDFGLFTAITDGAAGVAVQGMRFYKGKMYSSGALVRDYIPVRKDGAGYLYDKVSKTLFGNANSTGAFLIGNDKTI